ncbi:MAG TPA: hypothetical protein VFG84_09475 [Gemmatimonadaceae bacterium]|nr:hypothetical protein [Gemmatimonadaceae bacterium]
MRSIRAWLALALLATFPLAAGAQPILQPPADVTPQPPRHSLGIDFTISQPVGEFDRFVNEGYGVDGHYLLRLDRRGIFGLRAQLGAVMYGRESNRACLSTTIGCRILVDVSTTNNILSGGFGPQVQLPSGPVRPYLAATAGFSYFFTRSSVEGTYDNESFASTTNQDDGTFAWTGSGGVKIPLGSGRQSVMLDLGARYNGNGRVTYLRKGGIQDLPNGDIMIDPIRSKADLVTWHIGLVVGLR